MCPILADSASNIKTTALSRRLDEAKSKLAGATSEASSLDYPTELRSLESQHNGIKHELQRTSESITFLEQQYQHLLADMQALELEEQKEAAVAPDINS